jgi:hypothetical protein
MTRGPGESADKIGELREVDRSLEGGHGDLGLMAREVRVHSAPLQQCRPLCHLMGGIRAATLRASRDCLHGHGLAVCRSRHRQGRTRRSENARSDLGECLHFEMGGFAMAKKTCVATGLVIAALGGALLMSSPASAGGWPPPSNGDSNINTNNIENSNTSTNTNTNTNTATVTPPLI